MKLNVHLKINLNFCFIFAIHSCTGYRKSVNIDATELLARLEAVESYRRRLVPEGMTIVMAALSMTEIGENTKLAREMAMVGNYDSAGIYYEGVLQMVQKRLMGASDPMQKGKWLAVSMPQCSSSCRAASSMPMI